MSDQSSDEDSDTEVFVYRGGRAPQHITHAIIDESVTEIEANAFNHCKRLVHAKTHDGIRRVGRRAFYKCKSLLWINLKFVVEIEERAFERCEKLDQVEFGDRLERIGAGAFGLCTSLDYLNLPSIFIGAAAFSSCKRLTDIEFSERLGTIGSGAFKGCKRLECITIPLKRDLFVSDNDYQFGNCERLETVELVGGIHKTVASLHLDSWRADMIAEIDRINRVLPATRAYRKTAAMRQWLGSVIDKADHYKAEHYRYVKEGITLLELALWKAKLGEKEDRHPEKRTKKATVDAESNRMDKRITCGADMVIKNVLPFLLLE